MGSTVKMKTGAATTSGIDRGPRANRPELHDRTLFGVPHDPHKSMAGLKREFGFPPFSVFNTREGTWQARKRQWLRLGLQSELGRGVVIEAPLAGPGRYPQGPAVVRDGPVADADYYRKAAKYKGFLNPTKKIASDYNPTKANAFNTQSIKFDDRTASMSGVSIFDPVLCEIMYRWFCPPGGQVLDPFAGGSVRGIVAGVLGRHYTGIDLSERQIIENRRQGELLLPGSETPPVWLHGDSCRVKRLVPGGFAADFIFSCPPYADLEVYSDDPADISNMPYEGFLAAYRSIIRRAAGLLRPNRFAAWVVGEVRNTERTGSPYRGLVYDTIRAFEDAGCAYYNEAILVNCVGSLPLRTRRAFIAARKFGKTHQQVLVFCKGDPKLASFPITE